MDCTELDRLLHPWLDGELVAAECVSIEGHLAACAPCAKRAQVERHNHSVIRTQAREGAPKAPEALRARVIAGIHAEQSRVRTRRALQYSAAAAGLALAVLVTHQQYRAFQLRLYVEDAARRHARHFPLEVQQGAPGQLEAWFGGKLDYPVNVPQIPNATATGARLLQVRDKQAAYIRYDAPRPTGQLRQVGLFVYGDKSGDVDVGALPEPDLGNSMGYNVVSWRDGDVVYQLVTDLNEDDIRTLLPNGAANGAPGHSPLPLQPGPPVLDVRPASLRQ